MSHDSITDMQKHCKNSSPGRNSFLKNWKQNFIESHRVSRRNWKFCRKVVLFSPPVDTNSDFNQIFQEDLKEDKLLDVSLKRFEEIRTHIHTSLEAFKQHITDYQQTLSKLESQRKTSIEIALRELHETLIRLKYPANIDAWGPIKVRNIYVTLRNIERVTSFKSVSIEKQDVD